MVRLIVAGVMAAALWQAVAPSIASFVEASSDDARVARAALERIGAGWKDSYAAMIVDMVRFMRPERRSAGAIAEPPPADDERGAPGLERRFDDAPDPATLGSPIRRRLLAFLERQTGQRFGDDLTAWRKWMWERPYDPHPEYAAFKGVIYG